MLESSHKHYFQPLDEGIVVDVMTFKFSLLSTYNGALNVVAR